MGVRRALIALVALEAIASPFVRDASADPRDPPAAGSLVLALTAETDALAPLGITFELLSYHAHIETGATVVSRAAAADLHAFVDPTTDGAGIAITLEDRAAARTESRVVRMADVGPGDRARVVALALAELVRMVRAARTATRQEPGLPPVAAESAPRDAIAREPSAAARESLADITFGGAFFSKQGTLLLDARAAGERRLTGPLWAHADLGASFGSATDVAGDARLVLPSVGIGLRWRTDPGATLSVGAGPSIDGGLAFASASAGAAARAHATNAVTVRASIDGDLRARLGGALSFVFGVSAGVMVRGAELHADDRVVMGASGAALGARAGLAVVLP